MNESASSEPKPKKWWQWLLMYPSMLAVLTGAIPTFYQLYYSQIHDIPFSSVYNARQQVELWKKNCECLSDKSFAEITTEMNMKVGTIICPTGDILIRIVVPGSIDNYQWINLETLKQMHSSSNPLSNEAIAVDWRNNVISEQQNPTVLCRRRLSEGRILIRVRYPNGGCFDEIINIYTGAVISRAPAPCNSNC